MRYAKDKAQRHIEATQLSLPSEQHQYCRLWEAKKTYPAVPIYLNRALVKVYQSFNSDSLAQKQSCERIDVIKCQVYR